MATSHEADVYDLINQAQEMEHCPTQVMLLEQAVGLADAHHDIGLGYTAREELIDAATFSGYPEKALVAFSWCLAQCDRAPEEFRDEEMLWKYKWVVGSLCGFVAISRTQIEDALTDMHRRYERTGASLHAVHKLRRDIAMECGDRATAEKYHAIFQTVKADWTSDCAACVCDTEIDYLLFLGDDARALKKATKILRGQLKCAEVPERTYARVAQPLVRLGRAAEAVDFFRRSYPAVQHNHKFLKVAAEFLVLMVLTDNLTEAARLFQRHLPWALDTRCDYWRYEFFLSTCFFLQRLREVDKQTLKLRLPKDLPVWSEDGCYDTQKLNDYFRPQLADLAARFDTRNGNGFFTDRVHEMLHQWPDLIQPVPLRQRKKTSDTE